MSSFNCDPSMTTSCEQNSLTPDDNAEMNRLISSVGVSRGRFLNIFDALMLLLHDISVQQGNILKLRQMWKAVVDGADNSRICPAV